MFDINAKTFVAVAIEITDILEFKHFFSFFFF